MISLFVKGGLVMWPLLLASIIAVSVVIERLTFIVTIKKSRDPETVQHILKHVEHGDIPQAIISGQSSQDFVARTLIYGLTHQEDSFTNALLLAANKELKRFNQGLSVLDTIITLAPLLGLFGTVTGMINAFGLLGNAGLEAPTVITGGIAEALIATAFGLIIAIMALIPFNYLTSMLEEARHDIEDSATHLELLLLKRTASR
jgi:biopolymer transport protein ExbB